MTTTATNDLTVSPPMSKWQIAYTIIFSLTIPFSLYQRDWMWVCFASAQALLIFQRKESQMSFPVKVLWIVTMFGFMTLSFVFFFKRILSHSR